MDVYMGKAKDVLAKRAETKRYMLQVRCPKNLLAVEV
jgi:hypothetical protein